MNEKPIENRIKDYLKTLDQCWFFKHHADGTMPVGIPDILCCYKGRFIGIEVKRGAGRPSLRQIVLAKIINRAGGVYILADNVEIVKEELSKI